MQQIVTWPYKLRAGHSDNPAGGACAMDAVNWLVHGKHGDAPECACPVIGAYVIRGNDAMDDATRQRLLPYLHRIAGSRSADHIAARLRIMVLASARVFAAGAMETAGLTEQAAMLRAIPDDAPYAVISESAASAARAESAERAAWAASAASAASAAWAASAAIAAWAESAERAERAASAASAASAAWAASAASAAWAESAAWGQYFAVLDEVLAAGPQGAPWSADTMDAADALYVAAGGLRAALTASPAR